MKNRLYIFLTIVLLSLGVTFLSGNTVISAEETVSASDTSYSLAKAGGNEYVYTTLSDDEKAVFNLIGEKIETFIGSELYKTDLNEESAKLSISFSKADHGNITEDEAGKVAFRFRYANPKYYWISNSFSFIVSGDSISVIFKVDPYYYSYASRNAVDVKISEILPDWTAKITKVRNENDDYYAALLAHDLIISSINYSYSSGSIPETAKWAHSIAGVFTGQGAVCEGYSQTFEYLMDLVGIPNIYICGTAGEAHAWNAVKYKEKWYLCDVTWDDPNDEEGTVFNDARYTYFFMPSSLFSTDHKPYKEGTDFFYGLPSFADEMEDSYFVKFKSYSDKAFTAETGAAFASDALLNKYEGSDYVYFIFPSTAINSFISYVLPNLPGYENTTSITYSKTKYGSMFRYLAPTINHKADSVVLDKDETTLNIDDKITIHATLPENSDDRILWSATNYDTEDTSSVSRYVELTIKGNEVTVKGKKNGKVKLTATAYSSTSNNPVKAECLITIGTGVSGNDITIWANGTKEYKSATITTELTASSWKDSKGKIKNGKLVWYVSDEPAVPAFNSTKHTVSFSKSRSKKAAVNNKGVITAKKAGKVYVYICDTGSLKYEEVTVEILGAPSKIVLSDTPNSTAKDSIVKKYGLNAGEDGIIYINPYIKEGTVSDECTYSIKLSKEGSENYVSLGKVETDSKGYLFFTVSAKDFDRDKNKPASIKADIICDQSGKKTSVTIIVPNPVLSVSGTAKESGSSGGIVLEKKNDSAEISLNYVTCIEGVSTTTDKVKLYVAKSSIHLENNKVICDKGAGAKAKLSKDGNTLTITASKDAGDTSIIALAFTDPVSKKVKLINIAAVDASGKLVLF